MLRIAVCSSTLTLLFCLVAEGQENPKAEFLRVRNATEDTIHIQLRPYGRGTPERFAKWQDNVEIPPGKTVPIRLRGYQPFNIALHRPGKPLLVAYGANLCTWMRECVDNGKVDWPTSFAESEVYTDEFGVKRIRPIGDVEFVFDAVADEDTVTLVIQHDPPRKPRTPKRPR